MTKKQKRLAQLRFGIYALTSATLKYAGIKGWVENNEGQALLLIVSATLDLAFFNVDLGGSTNTPEELDTSGDVSLERDAE